MARSVRSAVRVGIVGPLLGTNPGWVTGQGEVLAEHLAGDGVEVRTASAVVGGPGRALDTFRRVRSWRGTVDVVVVLGYSGRAFALTDLGSRTAAQLDVPVILWLHGGNLPGFADRHTRWVARVLGQVDALVAPSPYLARLGARVGREVTVIPNVLPMPPAGRVREHGAPNVLWMRTFHPLYRPELAVAAFAELHRRRPAATLTLAGQDKGELEATRRLVARSGLEDAVTFAGFLDPAGKAEAFAVHDLFLNTTRIDNAPVSLLEAAAHGLVVVSTPAGGIADLFSDGIDVLLAEDAAGLAGALEAVLDDPPLAARLSAAGRRLAESATWPHVGPRWHALLDDLSGR